ncbi:MAG: membrane-bound lytic murein transglycosylase D, partial [Dokdonia sp.]
MRLLQIYSLIGFLLVSAFAKAQDTLSYESFKKTNKERVDLKRDTITIIDSITTTSFVNEIDRIELRTMSRDSIVFKLEDEPLAARLDSLWRRELSRMDLYDTINNMVHGLDYKEEVYLDLPTDTLKKRLALINERTPFNVGYTA